MATQGQSLSLDQAIQQASKLNQAGRLQEAHSLLSQVLKKAPKNAVALQQMAIALHKAGKTADAITHIEKAIKIRKHEAAFLSMAGEMHRANGNLDKAIEYGKKAVALKPNVPAFLSNLGVAYFDNGDLELAENFHVKALATDPHYIPSLNNLGGIAQARHQLAKAKGFYDKALALNPNHFDTLNNLGALLTEQRQPEAAIDILAKAINLNPRRAIAHCNIGFALFAMEQFEKAKMGFDEALKLDPRSIKATLGLTNYYLEKRQTAEALALILPLQKANPANAELLYTLGNLHRESGMYKLALSNYDDAITLDPTLSACIVAKSEALIELGKTEQAEALLISVISIDESHYGARLALARVRSATDGDTNVKWLSTKLKSLSNQSESAAIPLHFVLGKCHDDLGNYDLAFEHYLAGCSLKRKRIKYSMHEHRENIGEIKALFSKEFILRHGNCGDPSNTPIFIVGMPRSGTSLVEQIIASHPEVYGAGELHYLGSMADKNQTDYPQSIREFECDDFTHLGRTYISELNKYSEVATRTTDKMPANFRFLGLIHLALPNAKIIHIQRNPIDTCLSGFSKSFRTGQHQSYDLKELGQYYTDYHELMAHWRVVLPKGSFYDVQYEDLVADTEKQARQLIEYCGLPWDDTCLNFHKTERSVKTASVTQVRKPIYTSSVERWRAYEQHLGPLFEGLGDLAPK